jgi:hypothetical protein
MQWKAQMVTASIHFVYKNDSRIFAFKWKELHTLWRRNIANPLACTYRRELKLVNLPHLTLRDLDEFLLQQAKPYPSVMNLQDFAAEHPLQDYCRLEECFASSIWAVRASTCASVGGISLDLIDRWMSYEVTANTSSLQTQKKHNWVGRYTPLLAKISKP